MAALTTGMLIAAGVKAGVDIYSAHKANKANEKALEAQTAANNKALEAQKDIYERDRGMFDAYTEPGAASSRTLAHAMGLQTSPEGSGNAPQAPTTGQEPTGTGRTAPPGSKPGLGFGVPRPGDMPPKTLGGTPWAASHNNVNASSMGRTRKMQAPTGEVEDVPEDQVQHYSSLGAVEVQ